MARLTGFLSRIAGRNGKRKEAPIALLAPPPKLPLDVRKKPPEEILGIDVAWALSRGNALMVKAYDPNERRRKPEQKEPGLIGADHQPPEPKRAPKTGVRVEAGQKMWRSIAYHQKPVSLWQMLVHWGDERLGNEFTFIDRSVKMALEPYLARRNRAKNGRPLPYRQFLDTYDDYVLPYDDPHFDGYNLRGRDLVVWGLTHGMIGSGRGPNASLYGKVVSYNQGGRFLEAVLNRKPIPFTTYREMDEDSGELTGLEVERITEDPVPPLEVAVANPPEFYDDYYKHEGRAFAFWVGVLEPKWLSRIQALDVDIWGHVERLGQFRGSRQLWMTVILRTSSEIVGVPKSKIDEFEEKLRRLKIPGRFVKRIVRLASEVFGEKYPKIEDIQRKLNDLGLWRKVTGYAVEEAYQCSCPGHPPPHDLSDLRKYRFSLWPDPPPHEFLDQIVSTVDGAGEIKGDLPFGFVNGKPLWFKDDELHVVIATGPPNMGKTTTMLTMRGLGSTINTVIIPTTKAPGEAAPKLFLDEWGIGNLLELDFEDPVEPRDDPEELGKVLRAVLTQDAFETEKWFGETIERPWWETNTFVGLPFAVDHKNVSIRNSHKAYVVFQLFSEAWERRAEHLVKIGEIPEWMVLILDDVFGWMPKKSHVTYGKVVEELGVAQWKATSDAAKGHRKKYIKLVIIGHAKKEIEEVEPGLFDVAQLWADFAVGKARKHQDMVLREPMGAQGGQIEYAHVATPYIQFPPNILAKTGHRGRKFGGS